MNNITAPDYYAKFECIGTQCEDTCCCGWVVNIDRDSYHQYEQCEHPVLAPLFKLAMVKNTEPNADLGNNFGLMTLNPDGSCQFLQKDKLCAIQRHLGAPALCVTCQTYPRYFNKFGAQRELSLGISCPEAARLVLLNPQPMQFGQMAPTPALTSKPTITFHFPAQGDGDPEQIAVLNDLRAVIITIQQCRDLRLGARVMLLGFLLEDVNTITTGEQFSHAAELLPTLGRYVDMLTQPAQIETQFTQLQPHVAHKLELVTTLITDSLLVGASTRFKECLRSAAQGLAVSPGGDIEQEYQDNFHAFYQPFFETRQHIFENYLVNQVITRLFPFTRSFYLDLYREMVFNLAILQVLLVGMAAQGKGLDEGRVLQLFQSFARKSEHSTTYLKEMLESAKATDQTSFVHVMWLLKESVTA